MGYDRGRSAPFVIQNSLCVLGKAEKEYEMILKRTVQSICVLNVQPNTTTSIIIQVRQSLSIEELHSIGILLTLPAAIQMITSRFSNCLIVRDLYASRNVESF